MAYVSKRRGRRRKSGLSFYSKDEKIGKNIAMEIGSYLFWTFAMMLLAFVLVFCFGIRTNVVGNGMEPTLSNGQSILINRFEYFLSRPNAGDVIVFLPNGNENSHYYVKRIVAVPGDVVQIIDGYVYVNDVRYEEPGNFDRIDNPGIAENAIFLGEDEYFVLGDNRNASEDSRSSNVGVVLRDYIVGKAWFHMQRKDEAMGFIK